MEEQLDPQHTERVRRMLAEVRHTEPMPDDVAARLDAVLAGLASPAAEQTEGSGRSADPAAVVPLADRRRRAGGLLLAAAAVVVAGVAVGQVMTGAGGDSESAGVADTALEAPERGTAHEGGAEDRDPGAGAVVQSQRSLADVPDLRVRPGLFARDARRVRDTAAVAVSQSTGDDTEERDAPGEEFQDQNFSRFGCEPGLWGGGRYVPVAYGRASAWLVLRAPRGDTQVVDLFVCGEDTPERSTTLRFR